MERLQTLIKENGISKYRLAKDLHIAESTVRSWLKGISNPREQQMNKLAAYFRVPAAWIRYGDPHYGPTLKGDAAILAGEIAEHGPDAVQKARQMLEIWFNGDKSEKRYPIQKKTKGRKTA
mgnify:FL=1